MKIYREYIQTSFIENENLIFSTCNISSMKNNSLIFSTCNISFIEYKDHISSTCYISSMEESYHISKHKRKTRKMQQKIVGKEYDLMICHNLQLMLHYHNCQVILHELSQIIYYHIFLSSYNIYLKSFIFKNWKQLML